MASYEDNVFAQYLELDEVQLSLLRPRIAKMTATTPLQAAIKMHALASAPDIAGFDLCGVVREMAETEIEVLNAAPE